MTDYADIIALLLEKKEANRRDYEAREAKLDELLTACGYVAEVATPEPVSNVVNGDNIY